MRIIVIVLLFFGAHFSMTANLPTQAGKAWLMWPFAVDSKPLLKLSRPLLGTITRLLSSDDFFIGDLISALCALFWSLGGVANPDRSGAVVGVFSQGWTPASLGVG